MASGVGGHPHTSFVLQLPYVVAIMKIPEPSLLLLVNENYICFIGTQQIA